MTTDNKNVMRLTDRWMDTQIDRQKSLGNTMHCITCSHMVKCIWTTTECR